MSGISVIDYIIIAGYFAVLVAVGFYFRKMASASLEDYFLGGRNLPWWMLGISGMAAWLDLTGTMLITSFLFLLGPTGLFLEIRGGVGMVLVFMFIFIGKWHRRSGLMTSAEWMQFRFGKGFWGSFARLAQVMSMMIFGIGMMAYAIKGVGLFFSMFLPWGPGTCAAIMLLITCIYTIQSGFYGVVITDIFQGGCILLGVIFIVIYSIIMVNGVDISALASEVTGNSQWSQALPAAKVQMPAGYEHYNNLRLIVIFFLIRTVYQGMGVAVDNRYFGSAGERECGLIGFMSGWCLLMRWPLMMGFAILGLFLVKNVFPDQAIIPEATQVIKQHFEEHDIEVNANIWHERVAQITSKPENFGNLPGELEGMLGENWKSSITMLSYHGTIFPERILPAVLLGMIPYGIRGLIMVALMAASMSTINTIINNTTTFFTKDLYQGYIREKAKNKELIYASWAFGLLLCLIGFVIAFYAENINDIWSWIMGALVGGLVVPSFLRFYWWRFNGSGFAVGMVAGMISAVLQRLLLPQMHEWFQFIFILAVGFIASAIGTFATKPTDDEVLDCFYKKTRPFGLWAPYKVRLDINVRADMEKEHKNDIISIPFGIAWIISMLLLPILAMIMRWDAFFITLVVFVISLIGLYIFWYRNLPPAAVKQPKQSV
jgi:solute:Na+ symporter, SSS family